MTATGPQECPNPMTSALNRPGFTGEYNTQRMSPMTKQRFTPAYPAELRDRGVRLFRENRGAYASEFKQVCAADQTVRGTV
jgi:hypothetical protein